MSPAGAATTRTSGPMPARTEYSFTPEDFSQIVEFVHAHSGIKVPEYKSAMVYSRLAKRLRALGLESFRDYCRFVMNDEGIDERQRMLAALTTNMTSFFREPHHFEHLRTKVLPPLLAAARKGGRVRLWSAACSSGEEPYSIALTILSLMPDAPDYDIRILATDINPGMVERGRAGTYSHGALAAVPAELRSRWFAPRRPAAGEEMLVASETLQALISFRELNLVGDWPMRGPFQVVFCRNVVIYFEEETRDRVWSRFLPLIPQGGCLYIGHSERLSREVAAHFVQEEFTTFRRREGVAA